MTIVNKYIGRLGLLSFLLIGVLAVTSSNSFAAGTAPAKTKTTAAAKAHTKAKTAKKKRHHARRSASKSVKKS